MSDDGWRGQGLAVVGLQGLGDAGERRGGALGRQRLAGGGQGGAGQRGRGDAAGGLPATHLQVHNQYCSGRLADALYHSTNVNNYKNELRENNVVP